jgi:cytoskeleton protein RodZ
MPRIGDTLREARMRQQLDIADVEARTKIRAKYLRALENEEFGLLPGSTFVKTFLRTYAELLGLDAHRLVDEYRTRHEPQDELETQHFGAPAATVRDREPRTPFGPPGPGTVVLGVVIAVIALLLVLGLTGGDDDGDETARTETEQRPARQPKPKPAPPRRVTLRVAPSVPTYACVDTGDATDIVYEGILEEPRTFRGRRLRVNLGKTSVDMRANGEPVEIEQGPNPAGFEFTPKGMRPLPIGERPCA